MTYKKETEYRFYHPSGNFDGIILHVSHDGLMKIKLTTKANGSLNIKEGMYDPGEIRYIKNSTPFEEVKKRHLATSNA